MAFRKVAQFKEMTLEYVSPDGAGSAQFFTDMPGNHLASRIGSVALPQTNADKTPNTKTIPLVDLNGAPFEGTLYYPKVSPPVNGALQLRAGVVWIRSIGVYLDGTIGEFFETLPIPVGV